MRSPLFSIALALALAACTEDPGEMPSPPGKPISTTQPPGMNEAPPRKLVDGQQLATSPMNLLVDPGFGLAGHQAGFGAFLALYEGSFSQFDLAAAFDSRAPSGFGGNVALVRPSGATDKRSDATVVLSSFAGGDGPFTAQVWASRSDTKGNPTPLSIDDKGVRASLTDGTPDGEAFDLVPQASAERSAGGRTWTLLRVEIAKALPFGGFLVIRTGSGGGQFHLAAPEVTAKPLVAGTARSSSSSLVRPRASSAAERAAVARYKALPPRLVPAGSRQPTL